MNLVILTGEVRFLNDRGKHASFNIFTVDGWGENMKLNNHRCVAFGRAYDYCKELKDYDYVVIKGRIDYLDNVDARIIVNNIEKIVIKTKEQFLLFL